jgi:predicted ATPase/DNA-binding CsgD family transcriptional regulator
VSAPRTQRRTNVPSELTALVGRTAELRDIREALTQTRLLSLVGVGGVGKTRIAKAAARSLSRSFDDGAWLVDLAEVHDGSFIEQAIRHAAPGITNAGSLADQIGDANLLLVLDDCEHVIDAVRALVAELLPWCPSMHILTTTRLPLGVAGEHLLHVAPLGVEAAADGNPSDSAKLFESRVRAVTGRRLRDDDAAAVETLCRSLDGLPLAIELAAIKTRTMSVTDIIDALGDRFGLLRGGPRDSHPRHRSLDAMLRWSWDQCSADEKDLWAQFSVFVGSAPIAAIIDVCGFDDAFSAHETVDRLVQRSLLISEDTGAADVRFRMLDTIREFGRRALEEQAAASAPVVGESVLRDRHLAHHVQLVSRAEAEWFGPRQRETSRLIAASMPNIRLAFDRALEDASRVEQADRLFSDLWLHWLGAGQVREARTWAQRLDERLRELGVAPSCRSLWIRGWTSIITGDLDDAVMYLSECRRRAPQEGSAQDDYMSQGLLGACEGLRGDYPSAVAAYDAAIARARAASDDFGTALLLQNLGELNGTYGDCEDAIAHCAECAEICLARGDRWCFSLVLWVRALVSYRQGSFDAAERLGLEALEMKVEMHDQLGTALAAEVLAWTAAARGDHVRAAVLLGATDAYWTIAGCALLGLGPLIDYRSACLDGIAGALWEERSQAALADGASLGPSELPRLARGDAAAGPVGRAAGRPTPSSEPPEPAPGLESLTRREYEVAGLVGEGMTNKEIATTLVIGRRTVDTHVAHILAKLGFARRSEIAREMARVPESAPKIRD